MNYHEASAIARGINTENLSFNTGRIAVIARAKHLEALTKLATQHAALSAHAGHYVNGAQRPSVDKLVASHLHADEVPSLQCFTRSPDNKLIEHNIFANGSATQKPACEIKILKENTSDWGYLTLTLGQLNGTAPINSLMASHHIRQSAEVPVLAD